ncbi:MAG: hypothetical protein JXA54_12965 [Candidatus Heimdallarchaeota archaeon]|nr:hypothetical protein [Candidatus Heimdallarchaeota archaeon]
MIQDIVFVDKLAFTISSDFVGLYNNTNISDTTLINSYNFNDLLKSADEDFGYFYL